MSPRISPPVGCKIARLFPPATMYMSAVSSLADDSVPDSASSGSSAPLTASHQVGSSPQATREGRRRPAVAAATTVLAGLVLCLRVAPPQLVSCSLADPAEPSGVLVTQVEMQIAECRGLCWHPPASPEIQAYLAGSQARAGIPLADPR